MRDWNTIAKGERLELGLVSVDIAGHSTLHGADRELKGAKDIFREQMAGIAIARGGKLFNWAGDGGSFMFLTGAGEGFADLVFCAIQMLSSMIGINGEIEIRTDLRVPLDVRISCHSGIATFDADPGKIAAAFINTFLKNERNIGIPNAVCITDQVWGQLPHLLKQHFPHHKHSPELGCEIYRYPEMPRGSIATPLISSRTGKVRQKPDSASKGDSQSQGETVEQMVRLREELDRTKEELRRTKDKLRLTLESFRKALRSFEL